MAVKVITVQEQPTPVRLVMVVKPIIQVEVANSAMAVKVTTTLVNSAITVNLATLPVTLPATQTVSLVIQRVRQRAIMYVNLVMELVKAVFSVKVETLVVKVVKAD